MALTLSRSDLPGILARDNVGEREIDFSAEQFDIEEDQGGILNKLWNFAKAVKGFKFKEALKAILSKLNFQAIWGKLVYGVQFAFSFDFGASDSQLEAQLKGQWDAYAGQLGGLVGQTIGWLLCGVLPGVFVFKFNPLAGAAILKEVGEEAADELSAQVAFLCQTAARNLQREGFTRQFMNLRRWVKRPNNPVYRLLPDSLKEAWSEGGSWTIAQQIENWVETFDNQRLQNAIEDGLEELADACIEAGYVVAGALDTFLSERRSLQSQQVLEVTPNREYPNEKFILAGPEEDLRSTLPSAIANYELLDQRDVGIVSVLDSAQLFTRAQPLELYCRIEWRSDRGNEGPRPSYQVSSVKRSRLSDYSFIRSICGGGNGYLWGRWKAVARMTDGHNLTSYAATEAGAEERVRDLAQLSEADILTMDVTHELKEDRRVTIEGLQRDSELVRPHRIIITNRKYFETPQPGSKASKRGYWIPLTAKLSISGDTKPADWDSQIADILRGPIVGTGTP